MESGMFYVGSSLLNLSFTYVGLELLYSASLLMISHDVEYFLFY